MKEALKKYKEKIQRLEINFYLIDKELVEWINTKESKQKYIKDLIREDIKKTQHIVKD